MRLHRFYVDPEKVELKHDFWLHDYALINQWKKVLRFRPDQELVLFDGVRHDRLYKLEDINDREAHLIYKTDFKRNLPPRDIYLFWALLKKDKNDFVLQKCTELGINHFIPVVADRSEKTGFNLERAKKIVTEASEQCGRSNLPGVREPVNIDTVIEEFKGKIELFVCEKDGTSNLASLNTAGVLVGPEGGWSDVEKELFESKRLKHVNLHGFTLRAETAAVAVSSKLIQ